MIFGLLMIFWFWECHFPLKPGCYNRFFVSQSSIQTPINKPCTQDMVLSYAPRTWRQKSGRPWPTNSSSKNILSKRQLTIKIKTKPSQATQHNGMSNKNVTEEEDKPETCETRQEDLKEPDKHQRHSVDNSTLNNNLVKAPKDCANWHK